MLWMYNQAGGDAVKILVIRLSAMGDVVHCLPVAARLKEQIRDCHLTWVVEPPSMALLQNNPAVDSVIVYPRKLWMKDMRNPSHWPQTVAQITKFLESLKGFDIVMDMQGLLKSAMLAGLSGAGHRVGFASTRELSHLFLNHKVDVGDYFGFDTHIVDLNLMVADYVLNMLKLSSTTTDVKFPLPEPPYDSVKLIHKLLYEPPDVRQAPEATPIPGLGSIPGSGSTPGVAPIPGMGQAPLAVLIPGTTWVSKIWQEEKWMALGHMLSSRLKMKVVLVGGEAELKLNSGLAQNLSAMCAAENAVADLTGKTNLLDLIALFRQTALVVGADTGPLHLAAATGIPKVVAIHGSTPRRRNGPFGQQCLAIAMGLECQPCFQKDCPLKTTACLKDLSPAPVFEEIAEFLQVPG